MNTEIAQRWVEALKSGEYEQGYGYLNKNDKFCCLGVLCELAVHDGILEPAEYSPESGYKMYDHIHASFLPPAVASWAGMESDNGQNYDTGETLVYLNDTSLLSFAQLAAYIHENAERL